MHKFYIKFKKYFAYATLYDINICLIPFIIYFLIVAGNNL